MTFDKYQKEADKTAIYPNGISYTALGLCGEAGEYADKLKKVMRDSNSEISIATRVAMLAELGDVLWYVSQNARELDSSLEEVAQLNIDKLSDRVKRNKINGSGDNR